MLAERGKETHGRDSWPVYNIAIIDIVWCIAYTRGVRRGASLAQQSCNTIATVRVIHVWGERGAING